MRARVLDAVLMLALAGCSNGSAPDAGLDVGSADAPEPRDTSTDTGADTATTDVPTVDARDTSADAICPMYDAHARECFGEGTGENFLAECFAIYAGCGGVFPAVVRCRVETPCAGLGACTGLGC